ncbi:SpoIID/LytB domain-containing protein [Tsukamurella sp. 8F]|uniref:SpoIID/LytB domain-containing protein n=1 Tax=unclassified Tsukamurella TaxID=2633480 RepID=UPI0023B99DA9|nr:MULTISPECIES: SpoIID/LytB domain-containing protein [unclassified Tsukamurella]MDF0530802.1 SpoIID/LytB domain-containing protein [Tsukamurella sp. 8J]MDF0588328.1 SpoIID/LytB domain-containing protein [Tsukamurella sp. 8F]
MPVWIDGGPRISRRQSVLRYAALAAVPAVALGGLMVGGSTTSEPSDAAAAAPSVTFVGSGNGHGRGMGQWGAFGYAKAGWSAEKILAHYYGGTALGKVDGNTPVTTQLTKQRRVDVYAGAGAVVAGKVVAPGQAVSLDGTTATVRRGCGGPVVRRFQVPNATVNPVAVGLNRPARELLTFCGSNAAYRGSIALKDGKVYNTAGVDDYLRGVVPAESPAEWADEGGFQALRAQAVAARSYALSASKARGLKFDDTQASQVYGGVAKEDPRTDKAIATTAGLVVSKNGSVAQTEFSSSTGGYTAGGTFPAVPDAGDAASPYKKWTQTVSANDIGSKFGVGRLESIKVTKVQGRDVPRAEQVTVVGTRGTKTVSGMDIRSRLGLRSDVFVIEAPKPVAPKSGDRGPAEVRNVAETETATPGEVVADPVVGVTIPAVTPIPGVAAVPTAAAVPTVAAAPSVNPLNPVPTAPNAAQIAPSAGAAVAPVVTQIQQAAPTVTDPKQAAVTAAAAIAQAYQASGGDGGSLGKVTGTPVLLPGAQAMFQSYEKGTVFWTPTAGAQVIPSGVAAPQTLMNWAAAFASGGKPDLPNIPLLNLIPGWGSLLGITPGGDTASLLGTVATTAAAPSSDAGSVAPTVPNSGAPTAPGVAPATPSAQAVSAGPTTPNPPAIATAAPR